MAILSLENVEKVYATSGQRVAALRGVTFQSDTGDFAALMGPSGCGKSTLLHLIGGVDRPTAGTITLDGVEINKLEEDELARLRRRKVGFIFQFFNLLPTLSVVENVALPLMLDGANHRKAEERARTLLELVSIDHRAHHYPAELSGGEMQRTAIARALIIEPRIVLADEPTGNLDSENGDQVMNLLADLNRKLGVTILLATHSLEAARFAKRVIRLRDGAIERISNHERILQSV